MRNRFFLLLVLSAILAVNGFAATSAGACHAVGPSAAGTGDGSSWTNRMALPKTLVRGDIYYLMDGSYGSYTFGNVSGTATLTLKKAQTYDFGRASDGCSNDVSSGWSASTMGSAQAIFSSITPNTSNWILDGNGQSINPGCGSAPNNGGTSTDCGFKFGPGSSSNDWPVLLSPSGTAALTNGTIRYAEVPGANVAVNEEDDFMCWGGCNSYSLDHIYTYNSGCVFFKIQSTTGFTVTNSYVWKNTDTTSCHGQMWLQQGATSNVDFHSNVIRDITGTGVWVAVTGGTMSNWKLYNNVIWHSNGNTTFGLSNGIMAAVNSGSQATNIQFIGNSIINENQGYTSGWNFENTGSSLTVENNLYYNSDAVNGSGGFTLTESNNTCLNTSCGEFSSNSDTKVTTNPPNPFVDWANGSFQLTGENSDWTSGITLSSPFNVDLAGDARPGADGTWDRGAFEYVVSNGQAPAAPTNIKATVN